jgi:colicin import membrane protein
MASIADRFDFYPPRAQGTGRAFSLAVLAHLLLAGALTWGVSWKREATITTVEAELWSSLPQQAAPKLIEVAPPPPPAPQPKVEAPPEPVAPKAPDIAVEKEKPKPPKPEPKVESNPEPKPAVRPVEKPEAKPQVKPDTRVEKAADEGKIAEQREKERLENIQRMAGLAGASGAPGSQGTALQSSGPSGGYAGLIKGRVRPNLVFPGSVSGNPLVSVEVRLAPDGTVLGRPRVLKSSGNKEWDEAVVRAFEKTEVLPRDGGKIWSPLVIDWRVND